MVVPLILACRSRVPAKAHFAAEKEKGRKLVEASGLICGAGAAPALCLETRMVAGGRLTFCEMHPQMYPQTVPDTPHHEADRRQIAQPHRTRQAL